MLRSLNNLLFYNKLLYLDKKSKKKWIIYKGRSSITLMIVSIIGPKIAKIMLKLLPKEPEPEGPSGPSEPPPDELLPSLLFEPEFEFNSFFAASAFFSKSSAESLKCSASFFNFSFSSTSLVYSATCSK